MGRVIVLLLLSIQTALLSAGDWPQILGPNRDGIAEESFTLAWQKKGPVEVWSAEVGTGFSGPAVRDGKVYQLHRVDDQLVLQCYNAEDGKPLWNAKHVCSYRASISYDDGPRCVPTVTADQVITYGPGGKLQAVDLKTGQQQWIVDTHEKYKADAGYFGAGSSPLVVEDRVIVNVGGGRSDAGLVAFALKDGSELWKTSSEAASYSSPVVTQLGKQTVVLAITRMKCLALDPANGKTLFELPFGKRGPTVNAANPVIIDNRLFLTGQLWCRCRLRKNDHRQLRTGMVQRSGIVQSIHDIGGERWFSVRRTWAAGFGTSRITLSQPAHSKSHLVEPVAGLWNIDSRK